MKRKLFLLSSLLILGVGALTSCSGQITIDITTNSEVLSSENNKEINKEDNKYNLLVIK